MNAHLPKPIDIDRLEQTIDDVMKVLALFKLEGYNTNYRWFA